MSDRDRLWEEARELLAYAGQHRVLLRSLYRGEEGVFPRFAVRAEGCEITDESGRTFIDWASAWGPVILGYRHPAVEEAIRAQLEAGPTLSLMHPVEVDVARALTEMVPCAEMAAFGKNGSDVVTAAVRIARATTGREMILQHGFHGFHDWYTCMYENVAGTPQVLRSLVEPFPYDDLEALEHLFERFSGQVAAVVMEPVNTRIPSPGYLEGVREMAHRHGALLVFDELVTAFRVAPGGAQEMFGVEPDLACLGKAMANGMPLSALVGKREYMRHLPHVAWGMTFRGETLSLAAACATLGVIRDEPVVEHIARVGRQVRAAFASMCAERGVRCELIGPDPRLTFLFEQQGGVRADRLHSLFLQECAANGLITSGTLLPSYAHDEDAVDRSLEAFGKALDAVAQAIESESESAVSANGRTRVARGFIDGMQEHDDSLEVAGWLLVDDRCPEAIELVAPGGEVVTAEPVERTGVAESYPDVERAAQSGYRAVLPAEAFRADDCWDFELRARCDGEVVFTCAVGRRLRSNGGAPGLPAPYGVADGALYV